MALTIIRSGLISKLVADETELDAEVDIICEAIKSKSRAVIQLGKEFYYRQLEMGWVVKRNRMLKYF